MPTTVAITGNSAIAIAMRQINPDVVAVYPITPQTSAVEEFSDYVAQGKVTTELINVESEHSAMSACVGASAAGARVLTATSSQGLALMWEVLYIASASRLPIVMYNSNRTLSGPINIHCDHSDSMGARDSGWIQIYSETAQEAYDNMIQAVRISENFDVLLPSMVMMDGFITSHALDRVDILSDDDVKGFVGEHKPAYTMLDPEHPITVGPFDGIGGFYFEYKKAQTEAMHRAFDVIEQVGKEFEQLSGRAQPIIEEYRLEDAERAIVVIGSTAGTAKDVVDDLRSKGEKVGLLKIRLFRPFPTKRIKDALKHLNAVGVMDRADSIGGMGAPVYMEIRSALYNLDTRPIVQGYVYGLGGRDVGKTDVLKAFDDLAEVQHAGEPSDIVKYIGLKE